MGAREIITTTFMFGIGCGLSVLVLIRVIYAFLSGPKRFFWRRRDEPPACLSDPAFGSHSFVHLEDVRLHYVAAGEEDKPLMLMLHGFPEFWYSWRYQIKEFKKDYRVVALDQRGYSESDAPSGVNKYKIINLVNDVKKFIAALGYKSCVLVAHDWGGVVAWTVAGVYPELVDKLIIMNCPHPLSAIKYIKARPLELLKSCFLCFFFVPFLPELTCCLKDREFLESAFTSSGSGVQCIKFTPEDIEAYKYAFPTLSSFTGPINYYRAVPRNPPPRQRKIAAPTLVIWGCKDAFLQRKLASLAEEYMESHLTVKYIEEASHWVQMDCPETANDLMREFLK